MNRVLCVLLLVGLPLLGQAKHIIGGELSMRSLGKPGYYRIQMNQFWDETNAVPSAQESFLYINIFRKRNPALMATYILDRRSSDPIVYENAACAKSRKLSTLNAVFNNPIQLETELYTDPEGYYIVWERCCRDNNLSNLANSVDVGMVFYLEFPALIQNGVAISNSSPVFTTPAGNYICLNKPFTTTYSATDADGDELRYSLVTPLRGYTDAATVRGDDTPRPSYPLITWGAGYTAANAIPGTPSLQIDTRTGQLTVKATQVGYYLFTVQCDEYRNGTKIGSVRRDFVLPVVDCPRTTPPVPILSSNGQPVSEAKLCAGTSLTLTTDPGTQWVYQWQRNGVNLIGNTAPALVVKEAGMYTVVKSFSATCARDTISSPTQVDVIQQPAVKLRLLSADGLQEKQPPLCDGDAALLSLSVTTPGGRYQWTADNLPLVATTSQLVVNKSGLYRITVTPGGANCVANDSLSVLFQPTPDASLSASARQFCLGDSVKLSTTDNPQYRYRWEPVASSTASSRWVKQAGTYSVIVTTAAGCSAVSAPSALTALPRPTPLLDSVPPRCASSPVVFLSATPANGTWAGRGVTAGLFDPAIAGEGTHRVTYTVGEPSGCSGSATRWIQTTPPLRLQGPVNYSVQRGDTARLRLLPSSPVSRIQWQPADYLDRSDTAAPLYTSGASQQYVIRAETASGCLAQVMVAVTVVDRIYIPTAFSPNSDGVNDLWHPVNLEPFPGCEVAVFNRWGEVIYQATGPTAAWDGTYRQGVVEPGVYIYQVQPTPSGHRYSGQLTVLR